MKEIIASENAPAAIGPYSQAIKVGGLLFVSGQLPIDMATGVFPADIKEQTKAALAKAGTSLGKGGSRLEKAVKTTVFLSDMNNFGAMNEVYASFFPNGGYPARSAVQVARLPKDALVEIEVIAEA